MSALVAYWTSISNHDFQAAFEDLAPRAVATSEAQWIAGEQQAGIESASFSGRVTGRDASDTTVQVRSLITRAHQNGCQSWRGNYAMIQSEGAWRIQRADITPEPCN